MARPCLYNRLSSLEKFGYGLGDAGCNIIFQSVMMFLAFFYTDVFGLNAVTMGTMFLVVRFATAFADPIAGVVADRTNTRWGRFRPFLLWLSIPMAVVAIATYVTPNLPPTGKLIYAYVFYSLLMVTYSAINVPYSALGAVITPDSLQRVSLNGYRFFLATAANALVVSSIIPLVHLLGSGNDRLGFPLAMTVFSAVAVCMFLACFVLTQERVKPVSGQSSSIFHDARLLLRNDQWWVVAAINFLLFIAFAIHDGVAIYYVKWYLDQPTLIGLFLATGMVSSMIGAICAPALAARMSKANAYTLLQVTIVVSSVAMYFMGKHQLAAAFVLYGAQQFFTQMASPFLWSMMADTADYGEYTTNRRTTGLVFSGALLALKFGMAVGGALLGWLLAYYGYQSQSPSQSASTITGILILFTLVPAGFHLTLIAVVRFYRLDDVFCRQMQLELQRRHSLSNGVGREPTDVSRQ